MNNQIQWTSPYHTKYNKTEENNFTPYFQWDLRKYSMYIIKKNKLLGKGSKIKEKVVENK